MSERAFTPGPWHIVSHGDGDSLVICDDEAAMRRICFMATPGSAGSWNRIKANARLIAAAPELYEVLSELVETLRREAPGTPLNNHRFDTLGIKANAALAKATGAA